MPTTTTTTTTTLARVSPLLLGALAAGLDASAQDGPARAHLAWVRGDGAESCPDQAGLSARVASILGRPSPSAPLVEGYVERRDGRWVARLYLRRADGVRSGPREFSDASPDCSAVSSAVALAVALGIDPAASARAPTPPAPAPTPAPPAPAPRAPAPTAPAPAAPVPVPPAPQRPVGAAVTLRAVGLVGLLPEFAAGVAVVGEPLALGRWHLLVGGLYAPEQRVVLFDTRFAFGLSALSAAACFDVVRSSRVALAGCAGVIAGAEHIVVFDLLPRTPGELFWMGVTASLRFTARVAGPLVVEAGADLVGPVVRARFHLERNDNVVFEQSPASALGYLGVGLSFR